ncbi:MAG: hypothetical protein U9O50_09050 [Acidobacteriota bacterium]|nr:hypothetical protein [Acidobacteriota bacterium]
MRETSDLIEKCGNWFPIHPKPIVEGGRVLATMRGNRRCDRLHIHN